MPTHSAPSLLLHALLALTPFAATADAQQLVLPDTMNLGVYTGSTSVWRTTSGRFQVAYDASHFTNAGVGGPILITRLRFRAEDGQRDFGGHTYTGVQVEVGDCAVDYAAMSTTFASNRGPMGPVGTTNVTVLPASGSVPNDYVVDIDLQALGASWLYDPTTGADLLVDISFPPCTPTTNLVPFSVGPPATARGRMISAANPGATGFGSNPATLLVDFAGGGGYPFQTPARVERIGHGCGQGFRSFYQDFQLAETFDLANRSLTLVPDSPTQPTGYTVTASSTPPDLTRVDVVPDSTADEGLVAHALGFTFAFPGGSTTSIKASTNGFVWLDPAMTASDFTPDVNKLLGITGTGTARFCPCWYDFHCGRNTATHPNSGLHVLTDTSAGPGNAVCYVTWAEIGVFNQNPVGGASVSTLQCVLHENSGIVELRLGSLQVTSAQLAITGFSPGRVAGVPSMHPGCRDLSHELPFATQPDGAVHALVHQVGSRPILGAQFTLQALNQPQGALFGALLAGFQPQTPSLALPPLAPGCGASLVLGSLTTLETFVAPAGTVTSTPILMPSYFVGAQLYTQYAAFDAAGNVYASNGLRLTAGLN